MNRPGHCFKAVLAVGIAILAASAASALPVLPGATGFGIDTPAGRGGKVLHVTNLDDSGPGSLREAMTAKGKRVVVFDVSGTINLTSNIVVREPYLTLAGQTAPSPGILVKGAGIWISTHDVLVQHIALRPGDAAAGPSKSNRDAFDIATSVPGGAYNVVVDHISCSWSTDEVFTTWGSQSGTVADVTVRNSIISEGLMYKGQPEPGQANAAGLLIGVRTRRVPVYRNILAHNMIRHPMVTNGETQVLNNLVYRPGIWNGQRTQFHVRGDLTASVRGNVYLLHPETDRTTVIAVTEEKIPLKLFLEDNSVFYPKANNGAGAWLPAGSGPWDPSIVSLGGLKREDVKLTSDPFASLNVPVLPSKDVEGHLLSSAGSRPADRDPVDSRIIRQIKSRTGTWIYTPGDVGGYPELAMNRVKHTLPSNPSGDTDGDGYTDLEEWLHDKAAQVEGARSSKTAAGA